MSTPRYFFQLMPFQRITIANRALSSCDSQHIIFVGVKSNSPGCPSMC